MTESEAQEKHKAESEGLVELFVNKLGVDEDVAQILIRTRIFHLRRNCLCTIARNVGN